MTKKLAPEEKKLLKEFQKQKIKEQKETERKQQGEQKFAEFEKEYAAEKKKVQKEMLQYLKEANDALKKAVKLSEKTGIILDSNISPIHQSYKPKSYDKKWAKKLDKDTLQELIDCGKLEIPEFDEWQHSAVCW